MPRCSAAHRSHQPAFSRRGLANLILFGSNLNLYSYIGLVLLIGIVKQNGIMMVDYVNQAPWGGADVLTAIQQAYEVRFRPIMMTTFAAILGRLPLAAGIGAGAHVRQPLGLVVLGGLFVSQLVTLFVTPMFFVFAARMAGFMGLRRQVTIARSPYPSSAAQASSYCTGAHSN